MPMYAKVEILRVMDVTVAQSPSLYSHSSQTRTFSRQPLSFRVAGNC
jgi:hypothetical protein